ncbi:hypothetical protein LLEC1_04011 [Akanthomyces lecanii]|uniref:SCP domain-containing protein n=1 Tax=Cordyceps confragosa TaxID=2714763 RepID=A0A179ILE0_CORDF|nr:hypothetical protein LLEC1_04011 [Akanthomyces lecanii]
MKTLSSLESVMAAMLLGSTSLAAASKYFKFNDESRWLTRAHATGNSASGELSAPASGYGVDVLQWDVEVSPGQVQVLNGTVEEVYSQVLQLNPDYALSTTAQRRSELQPRSRLVCGNYGLAHKNRILEGVRYLRTLNAAPRNGPGPANCGRVSCSYNSAIWWCNDNTTPKTLDGWDWIANSAQTIVDSCASGASQVSGQNYEDGNWNTIVCSDSC